MRMRSLVVLAGVLAALPAMAQGTLTFLNTPAAVGGTGAPVTYQGARVDGAAYMAQLYANIGGSLTAIGANPVPFRSGAAAGFVNSTQVAVPGVAPGSSVEIIMRAWATASGATWEAASANPAGIFGQSDPVTVGPLGGPNPAGGPDIIDPNMTGLLPFEVVLVPEPGTWALLALGVGALALRRRRNK